MELTESTFSGTSDRVAKDEAVQKQKVEHALSHSEKARKDPGLEPNNLEAANLLPDRAMEQGENVTPDNDEDTPRRLPAIKADERANHVLKTPLTPRKNIIPARRVVVDNRLGTTSPKRNADMPQKAQTTEFPGHPPTTITSSPRESTDVTPQKISQPEVPATSPEASTSASTTETRSTFVTLEQPEPAQAPGAFTLDTPLRSREIDASRDNNLDQSQPEMRLENAAPLTRNEPANTPSADTTTRNQAEEETPALASFYTEYHDTSAAEAAWHTQLDQEEELSKQDTHILASTSRTATKQSETRQSIEEIERREATAAIETRKMATPVTPLPPVAQTPIEAALTDIPTTPLPTFVPLRPLKPGPQTHLTRSRALLLLILAAILLVNASVAGFNQFFGPQGWGSVWNSPGRTGPNLLTQIAQQLQHSPTPGTKGTPTAPSPTQIVNLLMSNMTLDEKLGQMMMIQFAGQSYSPDLDTMISQYHVGSVLYFQFNIGSQSQLTGLNAEMQHNANLPLLVSVDQEGGTVDRLVNLDGPQPSASQIGASNNPNLAYQQGLKDATDLASYGFNLNLAPVVDVNNVYNPQLYGRTYGHDPAAVSKMAEKYLEGLQHSGKVLGTLKHFPGLGDVSTDPHYGLPALTRDLNSLNSIDWAPYNTLIKQGHVYSIMVTHEIVDALDKTEPSSLSPQVIGILRNQMHFQGVIITDSLTMDSIHNFYTYGEAAAKAVEAGDDILMGADSPNTLAQMITGIKQAINSGAISQQHIDDSVRRILLFKYEMGLLHV